MTKNTNPLLNNILTPPAPIHYRETLIKIDQNKSVFVAALAKPNYLKQNPKNVFIFLQQHSIHTVFGLEVLKKFSLFAQDYGLIYRAIPIPDFTAPSFSIFDEVYKTMCADYTLDKKIAIHCRAGLGRTGTVLAALKLRELILLLPKKDTLKTTSVQIRKGSSVRCSERVKEAIDLIRIVDGSQHAVETASQVERLCAYEQFLIKK